jgi:hypothetical protein
MNSFLDPAHKKEILERLGAVRPDSRRQWGRMTPHQMICHLSDSFKFVFGEKEISSISNPFINNPFTRTVVKWIALYAPLPWIHGAKTRPEVDQEIGGTPPDDFERDRRQLGALIERFTAQAKDVEFHPHPFFGDMSVAEWMRWGYLHCNHHLRQFGA